MYILCNKWEDGYLDYYRPEGYVRIQVQGWWVIQNIVDMYIEQPRNWRRIWNYLREYGMVMVIRKIISRLRERFRDRKVLAIGLGTVIEPDSAGSVTKSQKVVFIAPRHPPCVERVVLSPELIAPIDSGVFDKVVSNEGIIYKDEPVSEERYDELAGWCEHSGWKLPEVTALLLQDAAYRWSKFARNKALLMKLPKSSRVQEHMLTDTGKSSDFKAVLFAFGNHAKTIVLPHLHPRIKVVCVHEIDPTQIGKMSSVKWPVDTAPDPRPDENYDVYLIAGFHHFHASQAAHALNSGAWAVVEKPLVTTWDQLDLLMQALEKNPERYFACFQKRYNRLWKLALKDLNVKAGEPIHYHCIVYEIPVPRRHWYNWPSARSRIVSNGCHWIDHFLFLNKFTKPKRYDLWKGNNGDLHVSIELDNGAVFGMHLTNHGSIRIGIQDHIELRANGVTVRVDNSSRYISEDSRRIIRKCRIYRFDAQRQMYRQIYDRIIRGQPGDDIASIRVTSEMMLKLEDLYTAS